MGFVQIAFGSQVVDNLQGLAPLNFAEILRTDLQIPFGTWFLQQQLQLQLQIFFSVTTDDAFRRQSTDKLYNPTQSQIGRFALCSDNFVTHHDRILYNKQSYSYISPAIGLENNQAVAPIVIRRTTNSKSDHAQNVAEAEICVDLDTTSTGVPVAKGNAKGRALLVSGGACLQVRKGQEEYVQLNQFIGEQFSILNVDLRAMAAPDVLQGVLWTGYRLEIGWQWGYNSAASNAVRVPDSKPIVGDATFTPPGQSCNFGLVVPNANFCPTGSIIVDYDTFGKQIVFCNQTSP